MSSFIIYWTLWTQLCCQSFLRMKSLLVFLMLLKFGFSIDIKYSSESVSVTSIAWYHNQYFFILQFIFISEAQCNCSSICLNISCPLTVINSTFTFASIDFVFKKPQYNLRVRIRVKLIWFCFKTLGFYYFIEIIKVDLEAHYKKTQNDVFTQFFKIENVDLCKFLSDMDSYPLLRNRIDTINRSTHGLIHTCPYKGLNMINHTISFGKDEGKVSRTSLMPNGNIRMQIILRNRNKYIGYYRWSIIQNYLWNLFLQIQIATILISHLSFILTAAR